MSHLRGVEFDGMLPSAWLRFLLACALSLAPVFAHAQNVTLDTAASTLTPEQFARLMSTTNRIGAGILVEPTYPGGNGLRSLPLPDVDWTYNNRYFANMEDGAGIYLYNDGTLSFGTSAFLRLGRDQTNSPKILGLGNIAEAPQARFATEYDLGWIDLKGAFAHDFSGSYGNTFQAKIGTALPVTNQFLVLPAVTTSLGDHNYMQSWYGVSEFQSLATGKPVFNRAFRDRIGRHDGGRALPLRPQSRPRRARRLELSRLECRQEPGHRAPRPDDDRPRPLLSLQIDVLEGDQARLSPLAGLEPAAASRARRAHSPRSIVRESGIAAIGRIAGSSGVGVVSSAVQRVGFSGKALPIRIGALQPQRILRPGSPGD